MDGYVQIVIAAAHQLSNVQLAILVCQGCLLSIAAVVYLWSLCNKVNWVYRLCCSLLGVQQMRW